MNIVEPLRAILAPHDPPEPRALPLGRGRWHVLFGTEEKPLLLPAADYPVQVRCLSYFVAGGRKALYARAMLAANAALPRLNLLPEFRIEGGRHGFLARRIAPGRPSHTALQIGTPGPFRKATAVLVSAEGDGLARAKAAMEPAADRRISEEADWLRELEAARELENQVPRLLAEECAPNGRRCLVTTLGRGSASGARLTAAHLAFLAALGRVRRDVMSFTSSACCDSLAAMLNGVEPRLVPAERSVLHAALAHCRLLLADWMGPFVIGHCDFVPWNIRCHGDRLFLSDWECARAGANPLADAFHFRVMPRVASGRPSGAKFLAHTVQYGHRVADLLYPEFAWRERAICGLALAYVLDVFLRHAAISRTTGADPIAASYLRFLEDRAAWTTP